MLDLRVIKFMGDVMAHPDKFKSEFKVTLYEDGADGLKLNLKLTGSLADLARGLNVEGAVEKEGN